MRWIVIVAALVATSRYSRIRTSAPIASPAARWPAWLMALVS